jgi:hypothetical protein
VGSPVTLYAFDERHLPPADLLARRYQRPVPFLFTGARIRRADESGGRAAGPSARAQLPDADRAAGRDGHAARRSLCARPRARGPAGREAAGHQRQVRQVPRAGPGSRQRDRLQEYAAHRGCLCPRPAAPGFFMSLCGDRLRPSSTDTAFRRLAGLQPHSARSKPSLKSLRHSFAVSTLTGWYHVLSLRCCGALPASRTRPCR